MKKEYEVNASVLKKCLKQALKERVEFFGKDGYLYVNAGVFGVKTNNPDIIQIVSEGVNIRIDSMMAGLSVNKGIFEYKDCKVDEHFKKYKLAASKKMLRTKWTAELASANFRMFLCVDDYVMINDKYDRIVNHEFNKNESSKWRWHIYGSNAVSPIFCDITTYEGSFSLETEIVLVPCRVSGDVTKELLAVGKCLADILE